MPSKSEAQRQWRTIGICQLAPEHSSIYILTFTGAAVNWQLRRFALLSLCAARLRRLGDEGVRVFAQA